MHDCNKSFGLVNFEGWYLLANNYTIYTSLFSPRGKFGMWSARRLIICDIFSIFIPYNLEQVSPIIVDGSTKKGWGGLDGRKWGFGGNSALVLS